MYEQCDGPRPLGNCNPQLQLWWSWGCIYFKSIPGSKWSGKGRVGHSEWINLAVVEAWQLG